MRISSVFKAHGKRQEQKRPDGVSHQINIPAPVKKGDKVGVVRYLVDGKVINESDITASEDVDRIGFFALLYRMLGIFTLK